MEVGNKRVKFLIRGVDVRVVSDKLDVIAVHLPGGRESKIALEDGEKTAAVFRDVLGRVFLESGKI